MPPTVGTVAEGDSDVLCEGDTLKLCDGDGEPLGDSDGVPDARTVATVAEGENVALGHDDVVMEALGDDEELDDSESEPDARTVTTVAEGDGETVSVPPRPASHTSVANRLSASGGKEMVCVPPSLHCQLTVKAFAQFGQGSWMHGVVGAQPLGPPQKHT